MVKLAVNKKKWIKYAVRALAVFIGLWILALAGIYVYVRSNKEKIVSQIRIAIGKKISGQVSFDDLSVDFFQSFPGISLDLSNVHIRDSSFNLHKKEVLYARHFYAGLGLLDLLTGKREPKNMGLSKAVIYLFTDTAGNKNWNIFKNNNGQGNNAKTKVATIRFSDVRLIYQDESKFKYYEIWFQKMKCRLRDHTDRLNLNVETDAVIRNASFNTKKGSYVAGKRLLADWKVTYNKEMKKITLQNQVLKLNSQNYLVTANFYLKEQAHFDLNIDTKNILLDEAASIFPPGASQKINRFKLSRPLAHLHALLTGPMKYLSFPTVQTYFSVNDAQLDISNVQFSHCGFNGFFKNVVNAAKPASDGNSVIQFTRVKGEWEKNTFEASSINLYNLVEPYLKCQIHLIFKLSQLDKVIASSRLGFNSGDGEAALNYEGPLAKADTDYNLNGGIVVHNADITYRPRDIDFKQTELELAFQNGDMIVKKMNTVANGNTIKINGWVNDFLNFFRTDSSKASFEWSVYSPRLDISQLTSSLHRSVSSGKTQEYSFFKKLNDKIDSLFDDCDAYINIKADKLTYQNFTAANIAGKVTLRNDMIAMDNFSLSHAGGSVTLNASVKDNGKYSDVALRAGLQNVNVKELFAAFNNFGMQSLTSKNINGSLSARISFNTQLDARNNLYRAANKGYVGFSLKNGKLENFKPLMDIDNNFLKNKDLSNVSFAELRDSLDINGSEIKINRMEIKSTAISAYVEGIYGFASNTDLSIQIPLLGQKTDPGEIPAKKGNKSKGGLSIFLRAKDDKDGKLKISYDLLGRFRDKK